MIHKIEQLTSIGKFHHYVATGDVALKKLTLFYADNGSGKTTLTSVLRSLTTEDAALLARRMTTNSTIPQVARLVQRTSTGDTTHNLRASGWSVALPDIEIFDTHFVSQNIFSGFEFSDDHKKQLYKFVIGAQGVLIEQQIEQNKNQKTATRQSIEDLSADIIRRTGNGLTSDGLTSFLAISTQNATLSQDITNAEEGLRNAHANAVIQTIHQLSPISTLHTGIDFEAINTDLASTTETLQNTVLDRIYTQHCQDLHGHSLSSPQNWLRSGFNYVQTKNSATSASTQSIGCPFCQQELNQNSNIFLAYTQKFNDEFNALVHRLDNYAQQINDFNIEAAIQSINTAQSSNSTLINTWTTHLPANTTAPSTTILSDENIFRSQLTELQAAVTQKQQNPSLSVEVAPVTAFQTVGEEINANVSAYNQEVTNYNGAIQAFKSGISGAAQAQAELSRLKQCEKRFDSVISSLCSQLQTEKQNLRRLELAYTPLVQQQEREATAFFTTYRDRVNHYLGTVFRTPFHIDRVSHVSPQGRAAQSRITYNLTINGQAISFDITQAHNIKDCLSDGDKSTLALAFFLAKLDLDPLRTDKIVVFDDPLSSFDRNRRLYTVQLIKRLLADVKQVIVLSHNEFFLHDLSKGISAGDKKILRITQDFTTGASSIEPLSLETLVDNEYFRHVGELENFLSSPDISRKDYVLGLMRNVLEAHIRFKFFRQTSSLSPNQRTFGNLITAIDSSGVIFRDSNRANVLSDLNLINAISCKPHHGEPAPDYNALGVDPDTITTTELADFVNDTLRLIDDRL